LFTAGQTFLFPLSANATAHLWVIATDPDSDGKFVIVSFTSLKGSKDQTVILHSGEHPFLKWSTCVAYVLAEFLTIDELKRRLDAGQAKLRENLSSEVLALVRAGFRASLLTKNRIRYYLKPK
jgi:hypothetical protein